MAGRRQHTVRETFEELRMIGDSYSGKPQQMRLQMLIFLKADPPMSISDVADRLGITPSRVRRWWSVYKESGIDQLLKLRSWRWDEAHARPYDAQILVQEEHERKAPENSYALDWKAFLEKIALLAAEINIDKWCNGVKEALVSFLPTADYIAMRFNYTEGSPNENPENRWIFRRISRDGRRVRTFAENVRAGADLVENMIDSGKRAGFNFSKYHFPPFHINLFTSGTIFGQQYLGTILFFRAQHRPNFSEEELDGFRGIRSILEFVFSDKILRTRLLRPTFSSIEMRLASMHDNLRLSEREMQILLMLTNGVSVPSISSELGISVSTVKKHVQSLYRKTGVTSYAELVAKYFTATTP